jgi:hypothetical protein
MILIGVDYHPSVQQVAYMSIREQASCANDDAAMGAVVASYEALYDDLFAILFATR